MTTASTEDLSRILTIGGGLQHHGAQSVMTVNIPLPSFRRPAVSAAASVTATTVFARFVSFHLNSLNQRISK